MPKPSFKKIFLTAGIVLAILALPFACRFAWLQFGPPYVFQGDTGKQVDRLTASYLSESNRSEKLMCSLPRWFFSCEPAFVLYFFLCEPNGLKYQNCFLELAKRAPESKAALNALLMANMMSPYDPYNQQAFALLVQYHADDARLSSAADLLSRSAKESFKIRNLLAATHNHLVAAEAHYVLGAQAMDVDKAVEARSEMQKALLEASQVTGADAVKKQNRQGSYQAPEPVAVDILRKDIEGALYDLNNLQVGMIAPEIDGIIQDGSAARLSDFRKKVIYLDFWGDW
jgi:hypothetical protein